MAVRSYFRPSLRKEGMALHAASSPSRLPTEVDESEDSVAFMDIMMERGNGPALSYAGSSSSASSTPTRSAEHTAQLRRPRPRPAATPARKGWSSRIPAPTPTCTPTETPSATPRQTPTNTPSATPMRGEQKKGGITRDHDNGYRATTSLTTKTVVERRLSWCSSGRGSLTGGIGGDGAAAGFHVGPTRGRCSLPPVPVFSSRFSSSAGTVTAADVAAAAVVAAAATTTTMKGDEAGMFEGRAGPFAGQGGPFRERGKVGTGGGAGSGGAAGINAGGMGSERGGIRREGRARVVPSIDTEVEAMFDESQGTLRLNRDDLGDERVPSLTLTQLREAYQAGTGSLRSWTTEGLFGSGGHTAAISTPLTEVDDGRLGVLSSTDAYLFLFQMKPSETAAAAAEGEEHLPGVPELAEGFHSDSDSDSDSESAAESASDPSSKERNNNNGSKSLPLRFKREEGGAPVRAPVAATGAAVTEAKRGKSFEGQAATADVQLVYLWLGREANAEARAAARAQGKGLLRQQQRSCPLSSPWVVMEVEQGCEPGLFLALFSYMQPPLAAVVLQGRDNRPELRVIELQESPCLQDSAIAFAVEGDASLLAKHGPLPGRSYVILVRPRRRRRVSGSGGRGRGSGSSSSDGSSGSAGSIGGGNSGLATFDAGYYWHGLGETPAVEGVGILLCQQVERMFPSPSAATAGGGASSVKRKRSGRRRRLPRVTAGCGMMRGFVADLKLGLPVPEGFWACILPRKSSLSGGVGVKERALLFQDLRPFRRSRPVRIFGVCGESRKAGQRFVWEVTAGGMPSQMKLSPSLSHIVDAGGSIVYVWHGTGSYGAGRGLAFHVARAYAERVEGEVTVEETEAGSEPLGLLDCFVGWDQSLVEPPSMLSYSPQKSEQAGCDNSIDLSSLSSLSPPQTTTSGDVSSFAADSARAPAPAPAPDVKNDGYRHQQRGENDNRRSSSASRLTPPGQRTPPLAVHSPPSLRTLAGGMSPCGRLGDGGDGNHAARFRAYSAPPLQPAMMRGSGSENTINSTRCSDATVSPAVGFGSSPLPPPMPTQQAAVPACYERPDSTLSGCSTVLLANDDHGVGRTIESRHDTVAARGVSNGGVDMLHDRAEGKEQGELDIVQASVITVAMEQEEASNVDAPVMLCTTGGNGEGGGMGEEGTNNRSGRNPEREGSERKEHRDGHQGDGTDGHDDEGGDGAGERNGGDNHDDDEDNGDRNRVVGGGAVISDEEEDDEDDEEADSMFRLMGVELFQGGVMEADLVPGVGSNGGDDSLSSRSSEHAVPPRRPSGFFRSPHSLDSNPPPDRAASFKSLSDVEVVSRTIFDTTRSLTSSRGSRNSCMSDARTGLFDSRTTGILDSRGVVFDSTTRYTALPPPPTSEAPRNNGRPPRTPTRLLSSDVPAILAGRPARSGMTGAEVSTDPRVGSVLSKMIDMAAEYEPVVFVEEDKDTPKQVPVGHSETESNSDGQEDTASLGRESEEDWLGSRTSSPDPEPEPVAPVEERNEDHHHDDTTFTATPFQEIPSLPLPSPASTTETVEGIWKRASELPTPTSVHVQGAAKSSGGKDDKLGDRKEVDPDENADEEAGRRWSGLNEDGEWGCEVARVAAGPAGAAEAERRRLAKINGDESWRLDSSGKGVEDMTGTTAARDVRRESVSFTRVQDGNVRNKLSVFEGSSTPTGHGRRGGRSSIGALQGMGLVKARSKNIEHRSPPTTPVAAALKTTFEEDNSNSDDDEGSVSGSCISSGGSDIDGEEDASNPVWTGQLTRRSPASRRRGRKRSKTRKEFLWKEGPSPPPLRGRPSLGLIRNGQVRIMSKALLLSHPEGGDEEAVSGEQRIESGDKANGGLFSLVEDSSDAEPPMPSTPPPPRPSPPPLPTRPTRTKTTTPPPLPARSTPTFAASPGRYIPGNCDSPCSTPGTTNPGSFWANMRRKVDRSKRETSSPAPTLRNPGRDGAWWEGGEKLTPSSPPPTYSGGMAGGASGRRGVGMGVGAVRRAAAEFEARRGAVPGHPRGIWMKLRRRRELEGSNLREEKGLDPTNR